jgi:hypothetical protein
MTIAFSKQLQTRASARPPRDEVSLIDLQRRHAVLRRGTYPLERRSQPDAGDE